MFPRPCFSLLLAIALPTGAVELPASPGSASVVHLDDLDGERFAEWHDGRERQVAADGSQQRLPQWVLWTAEGRVGHSGLSFGQSRKPGPRHLRIGFRRALPVGSVLVRGGGALSVLRESAPYPGDLGDPSHWTGAKRLVDGQPVGNEVEDDGLALWVLPPGTRTRALRFSHEAKVTDSDYAGRLAGALVLERRLADEGWWAETMAEHGSRDAAKLNNGLHDGWDAWENRSKKETKDEDPVVSAEDPEWLSLTWPRAVKLEGLVALWAGIGTVEIQAHAGGATADPGAAAEEDWRGVDVYTGLQHGYPAQLWPNILRFPAPVETRGLRLKITAPGAAQSHATNHAGRRVWLGELLAVRALGGEALQARQAPGMGHIPPPPVAIPLHLEEPGYVTLVIERPDGFRIRNLISETWFPAGAHVVRWDGTDDLGRDADAAEHGVYKIPLRFAEPGTYRVRGLVRGEVAAHYEFSVYTSGDPPWSTEDHTGAWIANHSPPQAAAFVPAAQSPTGEPVVYLGAYVTEGPDGVAWVDLEGRKLGGQKWIGGHWTAAPFLAADAGGNPVEGVHVYVASAWETAQGSNEGELRVSALTRRGDVEVLKHGIGELNPPPGEERAHGQVGGLAAHDGMMVVSLTQKNLLLFINGREGTIRGELAVEDPRGLAIESRSGILLVLSGKKLLRYEAFQEGAVPPPPRVVIDNGLEDPRGLTLDQAGRIYISDHGRSHQVKVFAPDGTALRAIGRPGAPGTGAYDPLHMNHPYGMAVDERGQLWVTEHDFLPKRVSVWSLEGELLTSYYGPAKYGGGGALDPRDKGRFYYADEGRGAMEFSLDWESGGWELVRVLDRASPDRLPRPFRSAAPEQALYRADHRYFTNAYNSNPTGGHRTAMLFIDRDGVVRPVAAMGRASAWEVLTEERFRSRWPEGVDPAGKKGEALFLWCDANEDADVQAEEVQMRSGQVGGVTVMPDLSFCLARFGGRSMAFPPVTVSGSGYPRYELNRAETVAAGVQPPKSSGGDQAITFPDGRAVVTLGIGPFDPLSISGAKDGVAQWSYPSPWPGLHASHHAPRPDRPGQLIGTTRLLGAYFEVAGPEVGPLWALHSNHGSVAVFTADGLFVATLFMDMREGKQWRMPVAVRDMDLAGLSLGEENFWPTLTHASEGKAYLVDGNRSAIIRIDGLDTVRRLPDEEIVFREADLNSCQEWQVVAEAARQESTSRDTLQVRLDAGVRVDGHLGDWSKADWAVIDQSGVAAYFNSNNKPYNVTGAMAISGGRLHAAWRTEDPDLLKNSWEMPVAPFKTGGALDLMLGPDGQRDAPGPGDLRLLVGVQDGTPRALLYRAVVPGTAEGDKIPFSSPWRTITFDEVRDVSALLEFAAEGGDYEVSLPLSALGLEPKAGKSLRGDIGILRGNGSETKARVYWHNKATGITADVPSEAMLTPKLWGRLRFEEVGDR